MHIVNNWINCFFIFIPFLGFSHLDWPIIGSQKSIQCFVNTFLQKNTYFSQEYHINQTNKLVHGIRLESESASSELFPAPRLAWYHQLSPNEGLSITLGMYSQNEFEFFYRHQNKSLTSEKSLLLNMEYSKDFSDYYRLEWSNYAKYYWNLASVSLVNKPPTSAAILNLLDKNYGIDTDSLRQSLSSSLEIETVLDSATNLLLDVLSQEQQEMTSTIITESTFAYNNSGKGVAIGTELSFKYDPNPTWRGWLSFDCALSKRKDDNSGIWYNFDKHRPWSLKWHNYFNMGNAWTLSLKYSYTGGMAYRPYSDLSQLGKVDSTSQNPVLFEIEEKNSGHYSPCSRFDIRLSQETQFYSLHLTKFFEIWNAFNVPNMFLADHESNDIKNIDFNYPFPIFFLGAEIRW